MALLTKLKDESEAEPPQLNLIILHHWMGFWSKPESCGYTSSTPFVYIFMERIKRVQFE
jgi:hypothetical protein